MQEIRIDVPRVTADAVWDRLRATGGEFYVCRTPTGCCVSGAEAAVLAVIPADHVRIEVPLRAADAVWDGLRTADRELYRRRTSTDCCIWAADSDVQAVQMAIADVLGEGQRLPAFLLRQPNTSTNWAW